MGITYHYEPDNAIIDKLGLFESTEIIDDNETGEGRSGCRYQTFVGTPRNGAVLSAYVAVKSTAWSRNRDSEYTEHATNNNTTALYYFFNESSMKYQLSTRLYGYACTARDDDGSWQDGQKNEYEFVGRGVFYPSYGGIDKIFAVENSGWNGGQYANGKRIYVKYKANLQPYRSVTYSYYTGQVINHKVNYTTKIATFFDKDIDDEGFEGLSVDSDYRFFELFCSHQYLMCDISGNVVDPPYDPFPSPYQSYPNWCHQLHNTYAGNTVSVQLAPSGAKPLSSDPTYSWMFEKKGTYYNQNFPMSNFRLRLEYLAKNYYVDVPMEMTDVLGRQLPDKMEDEYPCATWAYFSNHQAVVLTANDATGLQDLRGSLSATHSAGYQFAGFVGFCSNSIISSVFDDDVVFLQSIPFKRSDVEGAEPRFMKSHAVYYPVFVEKKKCVLNLIGSSEALIMNNYANYKEHVLDVAFDPGSQDLSCETLSANTYAGFVRKAKECAKYETAFINVFAHGDRRSGGEGTAIHEGGGWTMIESDIMAKILNGISKNVVYRTMCCFGAGTLMNPFRKHMWPYQFLPGATSRVRSKDGKSIMYIVNDAATSTAYASDVRRGAMFSDAVMAHYAGKDITYGQFVDKFNQLVTRCRRSVFKNLRGLFKELYDQDCLFAKLPSGAEITNALWRESAVAERDEVWDDLKTLGTKHPLNCFVDGLGGETYESNAVFWRIYNRIANPREKGLCQFRHLAKQAFDALESRNVGVENAYGEVKRLGGEYNDLLFSMGLNLGARALTRTTAKDLMLYHKRLLENPSERLAVLLNDMNYLFRDKEMLLGRVAYDAYSAFDLFDLAAMSKVRESLASYNAAVAKVIEAIFNGFYKTYIDAKAIIMEEIGDGVRAVGADLFVMIFINMVVDWPFAGFFRVTPEFEGRKFMT